MEDKNMRNFVRNKTVFLFMLYYTLFYMANGVYFPYINLYYLDLGFSVTQIGILSALGPIMAILTQPIWGYISDRARYRNTVLGIALIGTLAAAVLFPLYKSFAYVFFITVAFMGFYMPTFPLEDAITLEYAQKENYQFAPIRLFGTLGFAMMLLLFSPFLGSRVSQIFTYFSILFVITITLFFTLPKMESGRKEGQTGSIRSLLMDRELLFIFAYNFIIHMTIGYYASFITVFMRELNIPNSQIGFSMCIMAFSEAPVLILIERAIKRYGSRKILLFGGLMMGLRLFLFSQATGISMFYAAQLLQGVTYISVYYCSTKIVNERAPENLKSTAQAILSMVSTGFSRIFASIGGGYLSSSIGLRNGFYLMFWVVTLMTAVFIIYFFLRSRREKQRLS